MKKIGGKGADWAVGVILPFSFLSVLLVLVATNARALLEFNVTLGNQRLAMLPLFLVPATLIGLSSFVAHFSRAIPNILAWLTILFCAGLTIWIFALLN